MNAFELFGTISINGDKANSALDEISGKGKALASTLGKGFAVAGKAIVAGVAAGAAAVGTLTVASVKSYAEYEQLVGGVETLFKESSTAVMDYANNAYKSAGLSANEYMSTVTSFSASLLQGLGGDTAAAANIAHVAITDMADNANKMGTSMEMIQNAYQGFAKQNYTMLDNLKLGYGGTASEMARLINDSGVLGDSFKATAKNLKDIPFDKQIEAIHAIQEEMGITGTTAKEASETISGSWAAMGSAWTNLVTGIADDSQNLDRLVNNFAESAVTAFTNISKRIPSIVKGINQLIRGIAPKLPAMIQDLLPQVVDGAIGLIRGLAMALPDIMQILVDMLPSIMKQLASAFEDVFPVLMNTAKNLFGKLFDFVSVGLLNTGINFAAVADAAQSAFNKIASYFNGVFTEGGIDFQLLGSAIGNLFTDLSANIANTFADLATKVPAMLNEVGQAINTAWTTAVWPTIQGLFQAVFGVELPDWNMLGQTISEKWNTIVWPAIQEFFYQKFEIELPDWEAIKLDAETKLIEFANTIKASIQPAITNVTTIFSTIIEKLQGFVQWITSGSDSANNFLGVVIAVTVALLTFQAAMAIKALIEGVTAAISAAKAAFELFNATLLANPIALIASLIAGLVSYLVWLYNTNEDAREKIDAAWAAIKGIFETCSEAIKSAIDTAIGVIESLKEAWASLKSALTPISTSVSVHYSSSGTLHSGGAGPGFAAGAVFSKPTFFNTRLGNTLVGEGGESEAVAPISVLQGYVADAVASQNAGIVNALERVVDAIDNMNDNMGSNLRGALDGVSVGVNKREFGRLVKAVT
mgnify:CR=1 FL=1